MPDDAPSVTVRLSEVATYTARLGAPQVALQVRFPLLIPTLPAPHCPADWGAEDGSEDCVFDGGNF